MKGVLGVYAAILACGLLGGLLGSVFGLADGGKPLALTSCASAAWDAVYRVCNGNGCGAAFHIGDGRWLTAAHVADRPHAILYPGGHPATLHWRNPDYAPPADGPTPDRMNRSDYAVLQSDHAPAASIRLADAPPSDGQRLILVGWARGVKSWVPVRAERTEGGVVWLEHGGVGHGDSGAPVIDECGVAYAMAVAGDRVAAAGPAVHQMEWP